MVKKEKKIAARLYELTMRSLVAQKRIMKKMMKK